ncbi:MAG: cytochrome P460 family protein, partial [Chloroflexi bacterium]|nr:cytochrome P460 family protein [Chloroflexota bacterium]
IACGSSADDKSELPGANGAEVWSFLQNSDYQSEWELWPGTTERFEGAEPHGALHTVYANPTTLDALRGTSNLLPNGSIVVKDNFTSESVYDVSTIMYKIDGFDPENNDWFWAMVGADGDVRREGKIEGCNACHGSQANNDYIWIGPLN